MKVRKKLYHLSFTWVCEDTIGQRTTEHCSAAESVAERLRLKYNEKAQVQQYEAFNAVLAQQLTYLHGQYALMW